MAGKKGRSGRRKGSLNWSKTPAALAGHYLNGLIETWLAGVPIPTRPDWWLVQPTGRKHTVPPEIKRALAQAAIEYVVRLDATTSKQAVEQGRTQGPPIHPTVLAGRAGGRRPLRYAARPTVSEDAGAEGMGAAGRTIGEWMENPVLRAPSVFVLSSPAA